MPKILFMKKIFLLLIILLCSAVPNLAADTTVERIEKAFEGIDESPIELQAEENTINLETSVNMQNLNEENTIKLKADKERTEWNKIQLDGKVIKSVEFHAAYMGRMSEIVPTHGGHNVTSYSPFVLHLMSNTKFADDKTEFLLRINPLRDFDNYGYLNAMISEVYVKRKLTDHNHLIIGQARTAIGVEGGQSQYTLLFHDRSQIGRTYGNARSYGIRNQGQYEFFDYDIGVFDSTRFFQRVMQGAEFTGWVTAKPLARVSDKYGNLAIGTGINTGKKEHTLDYSVVGAYVGYNYKNFLANFEYANAHGSNGNYASKNYSEGFYTTLAYNITPKVQVLGRYDYFNADKHISGKVSQEYVAGINYYIKGQNLKLQLNYIFRQQEDGNNSNRYVMLTQMMF